MTEYWYRYDDARVSAGVDEFDNPLGPPQTVVYLREYAVEKITPKGVWLNVYGIRRFVLRGARKRFACPTRQEAADSFFARKAKQIRILRGQISCVQHAMDKFKYYHRDVIVPPYESLPKFELGASA